MTQSQTTTSSSATFSAAYDVGEEIGRGRFGVVSTCRSRATGHLFAVKSVDKSLVSGDPIDEQSLTNEPKALHILSAAATTTVTFTRLHGAYDSPSHLHLILDLFPFPSLFSLLSLRCPLPGSDARPIAGNLLSAVAHCHRNCVVHRDIKPENVLVDPGSKRVRLCDFGSAGFVGGGGDVGMTEVVGTPPYMAPEVVVGGGYGEKVDVWSAGVVLYVMVAGVLPFWGERVEEVFEKVVRGNVRFPTRVFGSGLGSGGVKDLLRKMLCKDVSRRFSAEDALKHPWIVSGGPGQPTTEK